MATDVEGLCNQALRRVGYETPIGSMYEGSRAARIGLEIYGQIRDDQLRLLKPSFSRRDAALSLLKTAPAGGYVATPWTSAYPAPPWVYEYAYPADCLDLGVVRPMPGVAPTFMPRPHLFRVSNDVALLAKVILTNVPQALAVYTGQIVDMTLWDATFTESVVVALSRRFAQALGMADATKTQASEEQSADGSAMERIG